MKNYLKMFAVIGVLIASCKKDKTPFPFEPPYNDLEHGWMDEPTESDFIDPQTTIGYFTNYKYQYRVPQFNPINSDEIVYYYINYPENLRQLVKYNLKTTEKTVLTDGMTVIGEPSWGSNGWIAFYSQPSHQLFLVKDNGTELIQITENDVNRWPQWSPDGNYLYWGYTSLADQSTKWLRRNFQTADVDTIHHGINDPNSFSVINAKISLDNQLLSTKYINTNWYFIQANLNNNPLDIISIIDVSEFPYGSFYQCWDHNSQYFYLSYYSTGKIFKVRVSDGTYELFRPQYYANWIETMNASPDGKYLVAERVDKFNVFEADGSIAPATGWRYRIKLIDLETKKIKILDLD